jgi:hypothetical protein
VRRERQRDARDNDDLGAGIDDRALRDDDVDPPVPAAADAGRRRRRVDGER